MTLNSNYTASRNSAAPRASATSPATGRRPAKRASSSRAPSPPGEDEYQPPGRQTTRRKAATASRANGAAVGSRPETEAVGEARSQGSRGGKGYRQTAGVWRRGRHTRYTFYFTESGKVGGGGG